MRVEPDARVVQLSHCRPPCVPTRRGTDHYFHNDELIVVFKDQLVSSSVDPARWSEVIAFGLAQGILRAELDFEPRTIQTAEEVFGIALEAT